MRKPGIRMMADRPALKRKTGPIVRLELGKAYTARKGSWLRVQYGIEAVYMVTQLPPGPLKVGSFVQVLGPRGVLICDAIDLRPCEEVRLDEEDE